MLAVVVPTFIPAQKKTEEKKYTKPIKCDLHRFTVCRSNKKNRSDEIFSAHRVHWREMSWCDRDGEITKKPQHADSDCGCCARQLAFAQNAIQCHLNSLFTLYFKFHYFIRSGSVCLVGIVRRLVGTVRTYVRDRDSTAAVFSFFSSVRDRFLWVFWKYNEIALMLSATRWCDCNTRCRSDVVWFMCGHCVVVVEGRCGERVSEWVRKSKRELVRFKSKQTRPATYNISVLNAGFSRPTRTTVGRRRLLLVCKQKQTNGETEDTEVLKWKWGTKTHRLQCSRRRILIWFYYVFEVWGARFSILLSVVFLFFPPTPFWWAKTMSRWGTFAL